MDETSKKSLSTDKMREIVNELHPSDYPKTVKAVGFEPVPGKEVITIFLLGNNDPQFYYRLIMSGTVQKGYRTSYFGRRKYEKTPTYFGKPLKSNANG